MVPGWLADLPIPDSIKEKALVEGEYVQTNDSTIEFTPTDDLDYNTLYRVWTRNVKVVDNLGNSIPIIGDTITFRTLPSVHRVVTTSLNDNATPRCGDSVQVSFNRKITSLTTAFGNLVVLRRFDSTSLTPSGYVNSYSVVPSNQHVTGPDSSIVSITPQSPMVPGSQYDLLVKVGDVTGDSADNRNYPFTVKSTFNIIMSAKSADSAYPLTPSIYTYPATGSQVYTSNEDITVAAIPGDSAFVFDHWECPQSVAINNSTTSTHSVNQSCSTLTDLAITAVYRHKQSVIVTVLSLGYGNVRVRNSNGDTLGGAGNYTVAKDDYLILDAWGTSGASKFTKWVSSDPDANGAPQSVIRYYNGGKNATVKAQFDPFSSPTNPNNGICVYGFIDDNASMVRGAADYNNGEDPTGILSVSPAGCLFVGNSTTPIPVSALIAADKQDCYCIDTLIIKPPFAPMVRIPLGCVASVMPPIMITPTDPATSVYFIAKHKGSATFNLTVDTRMLNAKPIAEYGSVEGPKKIGIRRDATVAVFKKSRGTLILLGTTDEDVNNARFFKTLPCKTPIKLEARYNLRERGYSFAGWTNSAVAGGSTVASAGGYDTYPSPLTKEAFEFTMDDNKKSEAVFSQNFFLRKVGFPDNNGMIVWKKVSDLDGTITRDIDVNSIVVTRNGELMKFGTKIGFLFSEAVDPATVTGNLSGIEVSDRVDRQPTEAYSANASNIHWTNPTEVYLDLYPSPTPNGLSVGIPKGEDFLTHVSQNIKSANGDPIDPTTALDFRCQTEIPGVIVTFRSMKMKTDMNDADGNAEVSVSAQSSMQRNGVFTDGKYVEIPKDMEEGPPCYKQLNADQSWVPNQWIFNIPRAYNDQVLNGTAHAEDLESEAGCPQADNTFLYGLFIVAGIVSVLLSAVVGWSFWYAVAGAGLIYTGVYGLIDHAARDSQNIWDSRWNYDWPDDWFGSRSGEFHYGQNDNASWTLQYHLRLDD